MGKAVGVLNVLNVNGKLKLKVLSTISQKKNS